MGVRFLALLILASCGRVGFDARSDGGGPGDGGSGDGMLPPVQPWASVLGGSDTDPTWITDVVEDAAGDLWVVGTSKYFGDDFTDGWIAKLDGTTGMLVGGGVRSFADPAQDDVEAALLVDGGILLAGGSYSATTSQQQALGLIAPDGSWSNTRRIAGSLIDAGDLESFNDIARTGDGLVLAGHTRKGLGSCGTCAGLDALVIRLDDAGTIQWASSLGTALGDESASTIVALPGGDVMVFGSVFGGYDYSGGAGTDVDSPPAIAYRLTATGSLVWSRELWLPSRRGGVVRDAVYDASTGEVVIVGAMQYETSPFVAQIALDGSVTRAHEVIVDDLPGVVSSVVIAADGGLVIVGHEEITANNFTRYVARLGPSRDSVVWAIRAPFGFGFRDGGIIASSRGDFVAWAPGASPTGNDSLVLRIGQDGAHAGCVSSTPASVTLVPLADNSTSFTATPMSYGSVVWELLMSDEQALPVSPSPVVSCSL